MKKIKRRAKGRLKTTRTSVKSLLTRFRYAEWPSNRVARHRWKVRGSRVIDSVSHRPAW